MKKILLLLAVCLLAAPLSAQTYVKLNGLYALAGVINPAVEFTLSPHSTFQTELVISPWSGVRNEGVNKPMLFGIFLNEYRYHFKQSNAGWYVGVNAGVMLFNMTKPMIGAQGKPWFTLKPTSSKGYGIMFGATAGYQWLFKERFMLDAFVGFAYMSSHYNAYALVDGVVEGGVTYNKGEVIMTPHRTEQPQRPDPFNGSAEWLPNKIGLSFGMLIFDPHKRSSRSPGVARATPR